MRVRAWAAAWAVAAGLAWMAGARADEVGGPVIRGLDVRGDAPLLEREGLLAGWKAGLIGKPLDPSFVEEKAREWRDRLRDRGYPLAAVRVAPPDYEAGRVTLEVDAGRVGRLSFTDPDGSPFSARWFSEAQLRYRLSGLYEGRPLEESFFYQNLLGLNAHPDLVADPSLTVRREMENGLTRRYADIACAVTERAPLHASLTVDNAGQESSGEWRGTLVLQHVNLTRRDDILSLYLGPVSGGSGSSVAGAAGYYRPILAERGGYSLWYAGYADVDAREIADAFRIHGSGWFAGARRGWRLAADAQGEAILSVGAGYRSQDEQLSVEYGGQTFEGRTRTLDSVPVSAAYQYVPLQLDRLGGRTFLDLEAAAGYLLGGAEEIDAFRPGAEQVYGVGRLRLARVQPVWRAADSRTGRAWLLFGRADVQVASGPLLGAEQLSLGGLETVRGFPERAALGDWGGSGTLEGRTPILGAGRWGVQAVLFADAGHAAWEGMDGETDSVTLAGAGAGVRVSWGAHLQARVDFAAPLAGRDELEERGVDAESGGRLHVRLTAQL